MLVMNAAVVDATSMLCKLLLVALVDVAYEQAYSLLQDVTPCA